MTYWFTDRDVQVKALVLCVALGILGLDLVLPLGIAAGVPYVFVVLIAAWLSEPRQILHAAWLCTAGTLLGYVLSPNGGQLFMVVANRVLALLAVWVTAIAVYRRRRGEVALLESRRTLATLLSNLPGMAYRREADNGSRVTLVSPGCRDLIGRSPAWVVASAGWGALIHGSDREAVSAQVRASTSAGRPYVLTYRLVRPDGVVRWVRDRGCAVMVNRATTQYVEGFVYDVTDLLRAEKDLVQADKMAAIGVLAAGFAHEIGNPMAAISALAEVEERRSEDARSKKRLRQIVRHVGRVSHIMGQMMDFAHPPTHERVPTQVNELVGDAISLVGYDRRLKGTEIELELEPGLPLARLAGDELMQVFTNLALNAVDAMEDVAAERPPRLVVSTHRLKTDLGDTVRIRFRDNGSGLDPASVQQVFEPFFTTKDVGRGTGLGLATSLRIVRDHSGRIEVNNGAQHGAIFDVMIPIQGHIDPINWDERSYLGDAPQTKPTEH